MADLYAKPGRCASCGREGLLRARGLDANCYERHRKAGTLEQFPVTLNQDTGEGAPLDGITYRQLDFWVRRGYLHPDHEAPGSGGNRRWTEQECHVARLMGRLVAAGFTPEGAHRVARAGSSWVELAPGVLVVVA